MIFLDTADLSEVEKYHNMRVIRGVTTNPTLLFRQAYNWRARCRAIARCIAPLPTSVQVTVCNALDISVQAAEIKGWTPNNVVKIPVHGSDGASNLDIIADLSHLKINATACMSAQQGLLAACAGAAYVSLFCGRIANMGYDPVLELGRLRRLLDAENLPTKIIAGSVREAANVTEWLVAGAHIVTVPPEILEKMLVHPGTKEVVAQFLADAERLK